MKGSESILFSSALLVSLLIERLLLSPLFSDWWGCVIFILFFFKLSPPPVIGRRCCILWRAPRFDSIVLQCGLSNRSSSVHCDVKDTSLFLLVLLFLSNHLLNTWEWTDVWGKVFHIIRKVGEEEIQRGNCFLGYAWRIIRIVQERLHNMELSLKSLQTPNWTFIIYL